MKKAFLLLFALAYITSVPAQTKAGSATLPNTVSFEGEKLILNGVGVRTKLFMDMYAGGLYLNSSKNNATAILNANEPMAIKLHIVSKLITSDRMIEAVDEGFNNTTKGNKTALSLEIEKFKSFFKDEITKDDVFDLVYLPARGTLIFKNGIEKGTIKGMEFKKALFGIWLSDTPADQKLKQGMLGK